MPTLPNLVVNRPGFTRKLSDDPRGEPVIPMTRIPSHASDMSVPDVQFTDPYTGRVSNPYVPGDTPPLGNAGAPGFLARAMPAPVRRANAYVTTQLGHSLNAARGNWRDIAVGTTLVGLTGWAVWATVSIHRMNALDIINCDEIVRIITISDLAAASGK